MYRILIVWALACAGAVDAPAQTAMPEAGALARAPSGGENDAAFVEPSAPLTLQRAIDYALAANPELGVAVREVQAREGARIQSALRPNPELGVQVEDVRDRSRSTTLELSQRIERGGKREARMAAADLAGAVARHDLQARRRATVAAVYSAFHALLAAQESQRIARDSLALAQQASAAAARRVRAGKVSPVEETRAKLAEASVRSERVAADSALRVARIRLSALWGNAGPRFERAEGPVGHDTELPALERVLAALDDAPAMAGARSEVERRRAVVEVERSRSVQDVTLSVGARRNEELGLNQVLFGVSIPLAINDRNQGALYEALQRADQARDELAARRLQLAGQLIGAWERATTARERVRLLDAEVLPGADSAYRAAVTGFELGKFSFLEVLDAQRTLFLARTQYLQALSEMHDALAAILAVVDAKQI
ncbi:TolC family protein [Methyloversatilis thermotolerans]|uniref:TolC family protein n=1 Tax=Methyloversatilis thermotolerans TaxID=1346290 RepID=UPI0003795787|nr:TolC family protein [Methyloversatilis thermotolerans]